MLIPQVTLPYLIRFQKMPTAEGPAADVVVTHVLDADLDLDTFALDDFGFGELSVPVPAGRQSYSTRLERPRQALDNGVLKLMHSLAPVNANREVLTEADAPVACRERLGGLLKHHYLRAA